VWRALLPDINDLEIPCLVRFSEIFPFASGYMVWRYFGMYQLKLTYDLSTLGMTGSMLS
jgi:hypothetical protein